MTVKIENKNGTIEISTDVISIIAGASAMECYGLVGMTHKSATTGIAKLLKGEHMSKGVSIELTEKGIKVDLYVIVQFGTKISVVADNIIEKVKYNIENQTGLIVSEVNLNIEGVRVLS